MNPGVEPNLNKEINVENTDKFGLQYQMNVTIDGATIIPQNILRFRFSAWITDLIPKIEFDLLDDGRHNEGFIIRNGQEVKVELARNKDEEPFIDLTFKVLDTKKFNAMNKSYKNYLYTITAYLSTTNLFGKEISRSFGKSKSSTVIRKICEEIGMEFEAKIDSNDQMSWLQTYETNKDFLYHVMERSYFQENDVCFLYGDIDGKMVLTSFLNEEGKDIEFTGHFHPVKADQGAYQTPTQADGEEDDEYTVYYNNIEIYDQSGYIGQMAGSGYSYGYWSPDGEESTDVEYQESELSEETLLTEDGGYISLGQLGYQSDNKHENFTNAISQNILREVNFSQCIVLHATPNNKVKLMSKIDVILPSYQDGEVNVPLSGEYLIGGIIHTAGKGNKASMMVVAFRNGYNKPTITEKE